MPDLLTIGYEGCTIDEVLAELKAAGVKLLVDVRAVPQSRKPGFSKRQLAAGLDGKRHRLCASPGSGDAEAGRDAVRAGHPERMEPIFREHMSSDRAQAELAQAKVLARERRVCLLCFEQDPMTLPSPIRRRDDRRGDAAADRASARGAPCPIPSRCGGAIALRIVVFGLCLAGPAG